MGLFDLFKSFPLLHDPFFGPLRFSKGTKQRTGYFEGRGMFAPTGRPIEYFIHSQQDGPSEEQRMFYRSLQADFAKHLVHIEPLIVDAFRNWQPAFAIQDFSQEFTLLAVTIPQLDRSPVEWDLSFSTVHDLDHDITIYFQDQRPIHILIDG